MDQLTKLYFMRFECAGAVCPVRNDALVAGFGRWFGSAAMASIGGLLLLAVWSLRTHLAGRRLPAIGLTLIVSGILGNAIDRTMLGAVRDFIALGTLAVVNAADIAIGAGLAHCSLAAGSQRGHALINQEGGEPPWVDFVSCSQPRRLQRCLSRSSS